MALEDVGKTLQGAWKGVSRTAAAVDGHLKKTFNTLRRTFHCQLKGKPCLIPPALQFQRIYKDKLEALRNVSRKHQTGLEAALFTRQIVEGAKKSIDDFWTHVRGKGGTGEASSYESSYLCEYIEKIEKELEQARNETKDACQKLVDYLRDEKFLEHLYKEHVNWILDPDTVAYYYPEDFAKGYDTGVSLQKPDLYSTKDPYWREIDHYLALLTEHLAESEPGRVFLDELVHEGKLGSDQKKGFGTVWSYLRQVNNLTGPLGKFFHNAAQGPYSRMMQALADVNQQSIDDVLGSSPLKSQLSFLGNQARVSDLAQLLKDQAQENRDALNRLIRDRESMSRREWRELTRKHVKALKRAEKLEKAVGKDAKKWETAQKLEEKKANAPATLDSAWLRITIASVALGLSVWTFAEDWNKNGTKDSLAFAKNLTAVVRDLARLSAEGLKAAEAGARLRDSVQTAEKLGSYAKWAGMVGGALGTVVYLQSAQKAKDEGQTDQLVLNLLGAAGTLFGAVFSYLGMSFCAGIAGLAALIIAVIIEVVKDPPIVVWLELTPWGTEYSAKAAYKMDQVIDKFFTKLFTLEVRVDEDEGQIQLASATLTDENPIVVSLIEERSRKNLGEKDVYPGRASVDGNGRVQKAIDGWHLPRLPRKIVIDRPWEIWDGLKPDGKTEYTVIAKINMDEDEKYELTGETDGKTFPTPNIVHPRTAGWFNNHLAKSGGGIDEPATGIVTLLVKTDHAEGCVLVAFFDGGDTQPALVGARESERSYETTRIDVKLPPLKGRSFGEVKEPYEVTARVYLQLPHGGVELDRKWQTVKVIIP